MIASPANDPDKTQVALVLLSSVFERLLTREGQTGAALSRDPSDDPTVEAVLRPCSAETARLHSVGDGATVGNPCP